MENLPTYRLTQSGPEAQEILDQVNLNTVDIEQLKRLYQALNQSEPEIIEPTDTWPVANPEENVIYRVIDRVNTPPQYYSDYMWNGSTMVLMSQYNNAIDNEPTANSNNLVKSGGVYSFVHANGGAYDISAAHAVGGVLATYDDLADALGTDGANVPAVVRKGGMSVKFVLTSDNKYVQYRYTGTEVTGTPNPFLVIANWQKYNEDVSKLKYTTYEILTGFKLGSTQTGIGYLGELVTATSNYFYGPIKYNKTAVSLDALRIVDSSYPLLSVKITVYDNYYAYVGFLDWSTDKVIDFAKIIKYEDSTSLIDAPSEGYYILCVRFRNEGDTDTLRGENIDISTDINNNIILYKNADDDIQNINKREYEEKFSKSKNILSYMGVVQRGYTTDGSLSPTVNDTRVSCSSVIALPHDGSKIRFKTSDKTICLGFRHGSRAQNLSTNTYWLHDGDSFTFPKTSKYFRFGLGRKGLSLGNTMDGNCNGDLSVTDVNTLIQNNELQVYFETTDIGDSIIEGNSDTERYIKAIREVFHGDLSKDQNPLYLPLFLHTSDLHGDFFRFKRFMDYADYLEVDGVLVTGDMVGNTGSNGVSFVNDTINNHATKGFICIGNHDTIGTNNTNEAMYNNVMKDNIDANDAVVDTGVDYPTYYYKDLTDKKIRIIALNEYDTGQNNGTSSSFYTQQQINWFIASLASTPAGYGVIILFHSPEAEIPFNQDFEKFYQVIENYGQYQNGNITGLPIASIVNAFISKTTLNTTFTEVSTKTGQTTTITIAADFTSKNIGAEFLFFACGHEHADRVGYVSGFANKMLVLDITCGVAINNNQDYHWQAEVGDLPRGGVGFVQDAFNLYAIDRDNGQIRIARVGSNMPHTLIKRDYLVIPYRN